MMRNGELTPRENGTKAGRKTRHPPGLYRRGRTWFDAGPLVVGTPGFGFRTGEVWALHIAWSGTDATDAPGIISRVRGMQALTTVPAEVTA